MRPCWVSSAISFYPRFVHGGRCKTLGCEQSQFVTGKLSPPSPDQAPPRRRGYWVGFPDLSTNPSCSQLPAPCLPKLPRRRFSHYFQTFAEATKLANVAVYRFPLGLCMFLCGGYLCLPIMHPAKVQNMGLKLNWSASACARRWRALQ